MASTVQVRQQKLLRLLRTFAADPVGVSRWFPGWVRQWHGNKQHYEVDEAWNEHLHGLLAHPGLARKTSASMRLWRISVTC